MRSTSWLVLASLTLVAACGHTSESASETPPATTATTAPESSGSEEAPPPEASPDTSTPVVADAAEPHHHHEASCTDVTVTFASGSFELGEGSHAALDAYARCVSPDRPRVLYVTGTTDPSGTAEANMILAQERGRAVAAYLESVGCHMDFEVHAYGESRADPSRLVWPLERSATVSETRPH